MLYEKQDAIEKHQEKIYEEKIGRIERNFVARRKINNDELEKFHQVAKDHHDSSEVLKKKENKKKNNTRRSKFVNI